MKAFRYTPLNGGKSAIRVAHLYPAKTKQAPLRCSLEEVILPNSPPFEALSYVWGDATITHLIEVDGQSFRVSQNLHDALRYLRHPRRARTLWIDAICINQDDVAEKSIQIPLMAHIYDTASSVAAWLGRPSDKFESAFAWCQRLELAQFWTPSSRVWNRLYIMALFSKRAKSKLVEAQVRALSGYGELFKSPYWERMWTFPEYYLPEKEPVCHYGDCVFELSHLSWKIQGIFDVASRSHWSESLSDASLDAPWDMESLSASSVDAPWDDPDTAVPPLTDPLLDIVTHMGAYIQRGRIWGRADQDLRSLLRATADRKYQDARDRVYALHGCCRALRLAFPANYAKSFAQVMLETTSFLLRGGEGLAMYEEYSLMEGRLESPGYPSWVLNLNREDKKHNPLQVIDFSEERWRIPRQVLENIQAWDDPSAWPSMLVPSRLRDDGCAKPRISGDMTTLYVLGRNLGIARVMVRFSQDAAVRLRQILDIVASPVAFASHWPRPVSPDGIDIAKKVLAAFHPGFQLFYDEWVGALNNQEVEGREARLEFMAQLIKVPDRAVFVTDTGLFGATTSLVEDGDMLMELKGSETQMILRPASSPGLHNGEKGFKLVDMAWVDAGSGNVREGHDQEWQEVCIL